MRYPQALYTYLRSIHWLDYKWSKQINPENMISLLRYEFAGNQIRLYAINCLNQLDDNTLNEYLLQLIESLKNEIHHQSFLSRFFNL